MDYNRSNPNGFVSTKTLVDWLLQASFCLVGVPDDSMVDGDSTLYEKVIKGEFVEFTETGEREC